MNRPVKRNLPTNPILLARARTMRSQPQQAEQFLWTLLRGRRLGGFKFRRQVPRDPFIADFRCHETNLIVEVDGSSHVGREDADEVRTWILERDGARVVRFTNADVFQRTGAVLARIYAECKAREGMAGTDWNSRGPHPGPLPEGEGG